MTTQVVWSNFIVDYIVLAFNIIGVHNTLAVWSTVYYWPNILIVVGSILGPYVLPRARREKKEEASSKKAE